MSAWRRRDLLWLLAYPAYQVVGTARHEASHALAAWLEGARVVEMSVLPRLDDRRGILWGYVVTEGATTEFTAAAPYLVDLVAFAAFFLACMRLARPRWLWLNLAVVGVLSPAVDTVYAYANAALREVGDVASLLRQGPQGPVHACFGAAIAAYATGLVAILRSSRLARAGRTESGPRGGAATPSPRSPRR